MPPFVTLITPSLQRKSLQSCVASVNRQSFTNWQHVIAVDAEECENWVSELDCFPRRKVICCGKRYNDFGNTPRRLAWEHATGERVIFLDDDNRFVDHGALQRIYDYLKRDPEVKVALFPILRHGVRFLDLPPGLCHTDSANFVLRREIAQWPDIRNYTADGIFIERLVAEHGYISFPDCAPIITVPISSEGQ